MRENEKKRRMSNVFIWIMAISFLSALCCAGKVTAGQPDLVESETEEKAKSGIFQVIFPGDTEHVFDFIMDPQKLISQTNAAAYGDSIFEEGATLFFRRRDGGVPEDYSSSSDALVIANTGTADVELTVTASISMDSMEGIALTEDRGFADDTDASLYLALTDGEHTVAIDEENGASICTILKGGSVEGETVSEYRFWLTGAVNENGDWSAVESAVPKVTVTWNVTPHEPEQPEGGRSPEESDLPEEDQNPPIDEAEQAADEKGKEPESPEENTVAAQPGSPAENKSETSGVKVTPEGPEMPDESGKTNPESPEPSVEEEYPKESEPVEKDGSLEESEPPGKDEGPEESKPSRDETDPKEPEPSRDETDPEEPEPSEGNAGSGEQESSGENGVTEGQNQSGETESAGEEQISGEEMSLENAEQSGEDTEQGEPVPSEESTAPAETESPEKQI